MNKFLLSLVLFGFSSFNSVYSQSSYCDDAWDCYDDNVNNENVYCRGYASCYGSNITSEEYAVMQGAYTGLYAEITTDYNAYCYGLYACVETEMEIENDFYNDGFASCAYSDVNMGDDYITRGAYAGYELTIDGDDYSYIYGLMGGAFSEMTDFVRTYNYGYYSLYYADVYSPGDADENVYFLSYGYYSGYGAIFYCQGTDYCLIYCDSTGCDELTVYVETTASYYLSCSSSCATCPNVTEYSSLEQLRASEKHVNRELIKQERREWINEKLGLKDGLKTIKNPRAQKDNKDEKDGIMKQEDLKKAEKLKTEKFHKQIYKSTIKSRKSEHLVHDIAKYHGHTPKKMKKHSFSVVDNEHLALSSVGTNSHSSKFNINIDIVSFGIGIIGTLILGVTGLSVMSKLQSNK